MPLLIHDTITDYEEKVKKFTFHYASTYTRAKDAGADVVKQIYIPLCLYLYEDGLQETTFMVNLHSTMPLLIPKRRQH